MQFVTNKNEQYLKDDKKIALALTIQFIMLITNHSFKQILGIQNTGVRQLISLIFMLITGVFYFRAIPVVLKRIGIQFVLAYTGGIILFLLSLLFFNVSAKYLTEIGFYFFLMSLPNFLFYLSLNNKKLFLNMILKSAYYQISLVIFFFISMKIGSSGNMYEYDMVYSYLSIVPVILLVYKTLNKFRLLDSILAVTGGGIILLAGARGPILCISVFVLVYIIANTFSGIKKMRFVFILLILAVIFSVLLLNLNTILNGINDILIKRNIHSRTLWTLINISNFDFSAGRLDLYKLSLDSIKVHPVFGIGIGGDRKLLDGTYPHNIVLETLLNFGVFFGLIFNISTLSLALNTIFSKDFTNRSLGNIFLAIGLVPLFLSGSYWSAPNFWLFLGICFCSVFKTGSVYNDFKGRNNQMS